MKKKKRIRKVNSPGQYVLEKRHMQECLGVSRTIPGDTFTIAELINRSHQGIVDNIQRQGVYYDNGHDDLDLEKYKQMDFTEREEAKQENAYRIQTLKNVIQDGIKDPKPLKTQSEVELPPEQKQEA